MSASFFLSSSPIGHARFAGSTSIVLKIIPLDPNSAEPDAAIAKHPPTIVVVRSR